MSVFPIFTQPSNQHLAFKKTFQNSDNKLVLDFGEETNLNSSRYNSASVFQFYKIMLSLQLGCERLTSVG